jgi:hypothetical protein
MAFTKKTFASICFKAAIIVIILLGINFIFRRWLCWHFEKKITPAETSLKGAFGDDKNDASRGVSKHGWHTA